MIYCKRFVSHSLSRVIYDDIMKRAKSFKPDVFKVGPVQVETPRLVQAFGDADLLYEYAGNARRPLPWSPILLQLRDHIQPFCSNRINFVLINIYRSLKDSVGWHSDNESDMLEKSEVASFSLGANRIFQAKGKWDRDDHTYSVLLENNSLLIMRGAMQKLAVHRVPKFCGEQGLRINFTFRTIKPRKSLVSVYLPSNPFPPMEINFPHPTPFPPHPSSCRRALSFPHTILEAV